MNTTALVVSFVVCLISAGIGMCIAVRRKGINREKLANIAVWIALGFASFLLVLIANAAKIDFWYFDDVVIGLAYAYFMADASIFDARGSSR